MEVESLLRDIENEDLVLPEFQRGFVWNEKDIKTYIQSMYKVYPTGSLLIWKTTKPPKDILKDLGIPSVRQQIEDFYKKLPPRKPSGETEINRESLILHIKILAAPLKCPICGETQIIWKCGHEFK